MTILRILLLIAVSAESVWAANCSLYFAADPRVSNYVIDYHTADDGQGPLWQAQLIAGNAPESIPPTGFAAFFKSALNFFNPGKLAKDSLDQKFGVDKWKQYIKGPVVDLSSTELTDAELIFMITHFGNEINEINFSMNPKLTNRSVTRLLEAKRGIQKIDLQWTSVKPSILNVIIEHHSKTLRGLKIDGVRSSHFSKLTQLEDLRTLDIHNSPSIGAKSWLPLAPTTVNQVTWFLNNKPTNFHTVVLPGHIDGRHHTDILNHAKAVGMSDRSVQTLLAYQNFPLKKAGAFELLDSDSFLISLPGVPVGLGRLTVRLLGVDSGEISAIPNTSEYKMALAAKTFIEFLLSKATKMNFSHLTPGKYGGRYVGQVWIYVDHKWISLSDALIVNGLAVPYFGEQKVSVSDPKIWDTLYKTNKALVDELISTYESSH